MERNRINGRWVQLNGSSDPTSNDGAEGDFWINTNANTIWGPKTATGSTKFNRNEQVLLERMAQMGMRINCIKWII